MSQERELNAFWNISQSQNSQPQNQQQKQTEMDIKLGKIEEKLSTFKKEQSETGTIQMEIEAQKEQKKEENNQKSKRNVSVSEVYDITIGSVGNSNRNKEIIGLKKNRGRKKRQTE